jgi:hypothetical protein
MGHNLFRSINVNTSFLQTTLAGDTNPSRYYYVNAFSYFPNLFVSGSLAYSQEGGKASELSIQLPVNRLTFGVSYDRFDQFYSEQSLRINPTLYNLSANVFFTTPTNPSLTTSLVVSDKVFENGLTKLIINHTLSNQWKFFYFQNRFTFNRSHDPVANSNLNQWTDVANLRLFYMNNYFELVPTFQQGRMETIQTNLQFQPSFNSQWNAILSLLENTSTHVTQVSITPTYRFSAIRLSNVVSYDTQKNIGFSLLCSTSLATDPEQNTWNFSAIPQSNLGFVTITAFKDKSKSGVFEKDDEPLANVAFNINSTKKTTGPDGTVVFSNLPTYSIQEQQAFFRL